MQKQVNKLPVKIGFSSTSFPAVPLAKHQLCLTSLSSHETMEKKTKSNIHIAWCAVTWLITTMMLTTFCLWHATTNVPISKYEWIWENYHLSTTRQPWNSHFNFCIILQDFSNSHFVLLTHKIIWLIEFILDKMNENLYT